MPLASFREHHGERRKCLKRASHVNGCGWACLSGIIGGAVEGSLVARLIPTGLAAAVMATAASSEPDFPSGDLIDNLVYAVIFFSIATTALLVFLFEKTGLSGVFSGWWFREVLADQGRADAEGSSPAGLQSIPGKDRSSSPAQNGDLL
ncbi:MAG: hypothetical protein WCC08_17195 [Terrimicrobiaceae bacterium]